jgi:ADP-heptose:LPS heptosyltransferase
VKLDIPGLLFWLAGPSSFLRSRQKTEPYDVLVYKQDNLGDFILALGALRLLEEKHAGKRLGLIVSEKVLPLARELCPRWDLYGIPNSRNRLRDLVWLAWQRKRAISRLQARQLIVLRHSRLMFQNMVLSWIQAEKTYVAVNSMLSPQKPRYHAFDIDPTHPVRPVFSEQEGLCRELQRHQAVVEAALEATVPAKQIAPKLERRPPAEQSEMIALGLFATDWIRSYRTDLWKETIRMLVERLPHAFVAAVPPEQLLQAQQFVAEVTAGQPQLEKRIQVVTIHSAQEHLDWLASAQGFIGVESYPAHAATALDLPAILLIGGGHYGELAPWSRSQRQAWLTQPLPCFGCNWLCIYDESKCIQEISPQVVVDQLCLRLNVNAPAP